MLRDTGGFVASTAPKDFENAGIRVVERHFKAKNVIFTPDDQFYFLL